MAICFTVSFFFSFFFAESSCGQGTGTGLSSRALNLPYYRQFGFFLFCNRRRQFVCRTLTGHRNFCIK